jgi:ElaB/YqjD/DUF883 family membrane-anchored ribosome-binding protein
MKNFSEPRRYAGAKTAADENNTEALVADIEETRAELCCTIGSLEERLNPEALKEQARDLMQDAGDQVRDATIGRAQEAFNDTTRSIRGMGEMMFGTIRNNPIPSAMVGLGLGWLWFQGQNSAKNDRARFDYDRRASYGTEPWVGRRGTYDTRYGEGSPYRGSSGYGYGAEYQGSAGYGYGYGAEVNRGTESGGSPVERAKDAASSVTDRLQDKTADLQDKASEFQGRASEFVGQVGERADRVMDEFQERGRWIAQTGQGQIERMLNDNPLTVGGLALAGGIALGLLFPNTEQENQWFGGMRDDVMDQVKQTAQQAQEKLKDAAQEMTQPSSEKQTSSASVS